MRKLFVLFAVFFAVLISGCTAQDPVQIVKDSVTKLKSLNTYEIEYDYSMSMFQIMSMTGKMNIYKKQNKIRSDIEMSVADTPFTISTYYLPTGTFSCASIVGNVTCVEGEQQTSLFDPEKSLDVMERMIEKNIVSLGYLNTGSVINRGCYNISSDIDISKISMLTQDEQAALGMNSTTVASLEAIKIFRIIQCYDSETGMSLAMIMLMEMDMSKLQTGPLTLQNFIVEMDMTASSFKPNTTIPDSVFELPAEVTEA